MLGMVCHFQPWAEELWRVGGLWWHCYNSFLGHNVTFSLEFVSYNRLIEEHLMLVAKISRLLMQGWRVPLVPIQHLQIMVTLLDISVLSDSSINCYEINKHTTIYSFISSFFILFTTPTPRQKYSYLHQSGMQLHNSSNILFTYTMTTITTHYLLLYIDQYIKTLTGDRIYAIGNNFTSSIISFLFYLKWYYSLGLYNSQMCQTFPKDSMIVSWHHHPISWIFTWHYPTSLSLMYSCIKFACRLIEM